MKYCLILFIVLFSSTAIAQKFVLLHKTGKLPLLLADTANIDKINAGYVGFYASDVDSIRITLNDIKKYLELANKTTQKKIFTEFGHTVFIGYRLHNSYGNWYDIAMYSFTGNLSGKIQLTNPRKSTITNRNAVENWIKYIASIPKTTETYH